MYGKLDRKSGTIFKYFKNILNLCVLVFKDFLLGKSQCDLAVINHCVHRKINGSHFIEGFL